MRIFVKLVVVGGFISWYECFSGGLDFDCIASELVLKGTICFLEFNVFYHIK